MKYIFLEQKNEAGDTIFMHPVIFDNGLVHSDIAEAVCTFIKEKHGVTMLVASAGTINIGVSSTTGESETLELKSRVKDKDYINVIDYIPVRENTYSISNNLKAEKLTDKQWFGLCCIIDALYLPRQTHFSVAKDNGIYTMYTNEPESKTVTAYENEDGYIYRIEIENVGRVAGELLNKIITYLNKLKK